MNGSYNPKMVGRTGEHFMKIAQRAKFLDTSLSPFQVTSLVVGYFFRDIRSGNLAP